MAYPLFFSWPYLALRIQLLFFIAKDEEVLLKFSIKFYTIDHSVFIGCKPRICAPALGCMRSHGKIQGPTVLVHHARRMNLWQFCPHLFPRTVLEINVTEDHGQALLWTSAGSFWEHIKAEERDNKYVVQKITGPIPVFTFRPTSIYQYKCTQTT